MRGTNENSGVAEGAGLCEALERLACWLRCSAIGCPRAWLCHFRAFRAISGPATSRAGPLWSHILAGCSDTHRSSQHSVGRGGRHVRGLSRLGYMARLCLKKQTQGFSSFLAQAFLHRASSEVVCDFSALPLHILSGGPDCPISGFRGQSQMCSPQPQPAAQLPPLG